MAKLNSALSRGEFEIEGFSIDRDCTEDRLLEHFGAKAQLNRRNGDHRSYRLPSAPLGDGRFVIIAHFLKGRIESLRLWAETGAKSWAEWSKAGELAQRDKNSEWVTRNLG